MPEALLRAMSAGTKSVKPVVGLGTTFFTAAAASSRSRLIAVTLYWAGNKLSRDALQASESAACNSSTSKGDSGRQKDNVSRNRDAVCFGGALLQS